MENENSIKLKSVLSEQNFGIVTHVQVMSKIKILIRTIFLEKEGNFTRFL